MVELFCGSCCSRATVGTDVTLIQHEDEDDAGPTFATVCDGPADEAVESGFVLAQLKLAIQLYDGDNFYYLGSKVMHSAATPLNPPRPFDDIAAPVRAYVVGQTACALLEAVESLDVKEIKTWKMPRALRLKRKHWLLEQLVE